jgi:DNA recombination protein RmuC
MEMMVLLVIAGMVILLITLAFLMRQIQNAKSDLQTQVNQMQQQFSQRFDANIQTVAGHLGIITNQMGQTAGIVAQVEGKLGQLQEAGRQIYDLGRDISSLHDILQSPKLRGGIGEFLLGDLLAQCLQSGFYQLQYPFSNGCIVDAALFFEGKILCVDSKFPLENFRKLMAAESEDKRKSLRKQFLADVKKHVNDIADKYILPEENTLDFAFMFIPAENVYYELIVREDASLYDHAVKRRVIPVSPNTFYAYLQVALTGLRGFQISEKAGEILAQLQQFTNDLERFETDFAKIGAHLRDAANSFNRSDDRLQKLKQKVTSIV